MLVGLGRHHHTALARMHRVHALRHVVRHLVLWLEALANPLWLQHGWVAKATHAALPMHHLTRVHHKHHLLLRGHHLRLLK